MYEAVYGQYRTFYEAYVDVSANSDLENETSAILLRRHEGIPTARNHAGEAVCKVLKHISPRCWLSKQS